MLDQGAKEPVPISMKCKFPLCSLVQFMKESYVWESETLLLLCTKRFRLPSLGGSEKETVEMCQMPLLCGSAMSVTAFPGLPEFRLNKKKPFATVGIDFLCHLIVKNGSKKQKCYSCLFACRTTRYVNWEIMIDIFTVQFLQAFRRHGSVYGTPSLYLVTMPRHL